MKMVGLPQTAALKASSESSRRCSLFLLLNGIEGDIPDSIGGGFGLQNSCRFPASGTARTFSYMGSFDYLRVLDLPGGFSESFRALAELST